MSLNWLSGSDFANLFGISIDQLPDVSERLIAGHDFSYRVPHGTGRDQIILRILKKIHSSDISITGYSKKASWEQGWQENLENFIESNYDPRQLVPKYFRPGEPIRLLGDWVMPSDPKFEFNFYSILTDWLFRTYLKEVDAIYEFGCGPGHNLVKLAELYPDKYLHGLEWVRAPKEIIHLLAKRYGYKMWGHFFDMFSPDDSLVVPPTSAFLAINSLEQLGANFEAFLQFTLRKKPAIFVQIDTFSELYDEDNLSDYLALLHNKRRKYLEGYLTRLYELEASGYLNVIKVQKVACGGLYHDGFSYVVWRPK